MIEVLGNKGIKKIVSNYLHDKIISCETDKVKNWKFLAKTEAKFNLSSMAIKKEVLSSWTDVISKINLAVDNFFFYVALKERGCIMIDSDVLTKYRISDKKDYVKNEDELLYFKQYVALKYYEDFSLFKNIFENEFFSESVKEGLLFWFLEYKTLSKEIRIPNSFQLKNFLDIILKNKVLLLLFLASLLPFKIRKYFIYKYLGIK